MISVNYSKLKYQPRTRPRGDAPACYVPHTPRYRARLGSRAARRANAYPVCAYPIAVILAIVGTTETEREREYLSRDWRDRRKGRFGARDSQPSVSRSRFISAERNAGRRERKRPLDSRAGCFAEQSPRYFDRDLICSLSLSLSPERARTYRSHSRLAN